MIILTINGEDYNLFESWSEITLDKGRELFVAASKAPEHLLGIYKEQAKGDGADNDQIRIKEKALKQKDLDKFYCSILEVLSNIPNKIIKGINKGDLKICYDRLLFQFVFGVLYFPVDGVIEMDSFTFCGTTYLAPKSKEILGTERPFYQENVAAYCDASDLDSQGRQSEHGKYHFAELIVAILFREYANIYTKEEEAIETAESFKGVLTCDVFHSALYHLSKANNILKTFFPNLYQSSGDAKSKQASTESGLKDFGWFNSILNIAEMGILNKTGLTPLQSVREAELYEFMTVLSNMRANSDYQKIYREKNK